MKMLQLDQEFGFIVTFAKLLRPHGFLALVQAAAELAVSFFLYDFCTRQPLT